MSIRITAVLLLVAALVGCDRQDPERLNRVGKKLVEKGRKLADDADLPRIEITQPSDEERKK